jgi:hypothetical protein
VSQPECPQRDGIPPPQERTTGRAEQATARPLWLLRSYLELSPLPTAVPCARGHARLVMAEWNLACLADTVELIVSELVTNGLRASAGLLGSRFGGRWSPGVPPVRMWLSSDYCTVLPALLAPLFAQARERESPAGGISWRWPGWRGRR